MIFSPTNLDGAYLIGLEPREDSRGFFARMFCSDEFAQNGLETNWVQINNSFTKTAGTVRGLHFQSPPAAEVKLVRCVRGAIWDVMVDLRSDSATYGKWFAAELSAENRLMMYIPRGFAHGFQALTDDCEILYLNSAAYNTVYEGGVRYDDPALQIDWPLPVDMVSERDKNLPFIHTL